MHHDISGELQLMRTTNDAEKDGPPSINARRPESGAHRYPGFIYTNSNHLFTQATEGDTNEGSKSSKDSKQYYSYGHLRAAGGNVQYQAPPHLKRCQDVRWIATQRLLGV